MTLRWRLTLGYGALFSLVLTVVILVSYSYHTRGHYEDLDRVLLTSVGHALRETPGEATLHLAVGDGGLEVGLRLYGSDGDLVEWTAGSEAGPAFEPALLLAAPAVPAYDPLAALLPASAAGVTPPAGSAFGLLADAQQRWRLYVQPVEPEGYVAALSPLGRLDQSLARYRTLLGLVGVAGLAAGLVGSWLIASAALRPVADLTATAAAVAASRDLSRRVASPARGDELGQMADTFNTMLGAIEEAHRVQQRFIADASHELRAPLTVIQGNLGLLRRGHVIPAAEREEMLGEIGAESARMARLVSELLALARADAGVPLTFRPVELDSVLLDTFQQARQLASGQHLVLDAIEPVSLAGDEDRLKQLLLILLDNALKYTPAGGEVRLSMQQQPEQAEVTVSDSGIGIPAEALPHVFERFYRADSARSRDPGGSGLGLAIARTIARQHGGDIAIRSQAAQGTTVTVRLPLAGGDTGTR